MEKLISELTKKQKIAPYEGLTFSKMGSAKIKKNYYSGFPKWTKKTQQQFFEMVKNFKREDLVVLREVGYDLELDPWNLIQCVAVYGDVSALAIIMECPQINSTVALSICLNLGLDEKCKVLMNKPGYMDFGSYLLEEACRPTENALDNFPDARQKPNLNLIKKLVEEGARSDYVLAYAAEREDETNFNWLLKNYPLNNDSLLQGARSFLKSPLKIDKIQTLVDIKYDLPSNQILYYLFLENKKPNERVVALEYLLQFDFAAAQKKLPITEFMEDIKIDEFKMLISKNFDLQKEMSVLLEKSIQSSNKEIMNYLLVHTNAVAAVGQIMELSLFENSAEDVKGILRDFVLRSQFKNEPEKTRSKLLKNKSRI